jgi:hypothetical protein
MTLEEGEVPADFLARLEPVSPRRLPHFLPQSPETTLHDEVDSSLNDEDEKGFLGGSPGTRTLNQRVKSPLLYQLS